MGRGSGGEAACVWAPLGLGLAVESVVCGCRVAAECVCVFWFRRVFESVRGGARRRRSSWRHWCEL